MGNHRVFSRSDESHREIRKRNPNPRRLSWPSVNWPGVRWLRGARAETLSWEIIAYSADRKKVIERFGSEIPILGVCLGHQSIGQVFGGCVVRAPKLFHGKSSRIQ